MPSRLFRFIKDRQAASAVEFALIAPVMVLLLLGSFDIARAIEVKTKVTTLARTISDFVTQSETISPAELANLFEASKTILAPYTDSPEVLSIHVESIRRSRDGTFRIDWSYPPKDASDRATSIVPADESVVKTDVTYVHRLHFASYLFGQLGWDNITLSSTSSMTPRWGAPVEAVNF